jgi:hypothetical protein
MTQAPQLSGKPRNAHRLLALWETFGKYIGLPDRDWEELAPVLDRLPPLELANPRIDKPAAEAVLQKYAMRDDVKPCPVRWFPDARSAHACHPALALWARCAFPLTDPPAALSAAWHAGAAAGGPALVDLSSTGAKALAAAGNAGPEITSLAALLEMCGGLALLLALRKSFAFPAPRCGSAGVGGSIARMAPRWNGRRANGTSSGTISRCRNGSSSILI